MFGVFLLPIRLLLHMSPADSGEPHPHWQAMDAGGGLVAEFEKLPVQAGKGDELPTLPKHAHALVFE